jgi:hypothetical protein
MTFLCNVFVDDFFQRVLVGQADDLFDHLAALEQKQRRNAPDAELERCIRILVDVQLADDELSVVVPRKLLDGGRQAAARPAPLRPEINEDGRAAGDRLVEVAVGERLNLVGCHQFPLYTL